MEKNTSYHIITNSAHRNIIIVNDVVDIDNDPDLEFEDFDAIFINVIDSVRDRVMLALRLASPLLSEKCRFKPCFVTQRLKGWLGSYDIIVDGYATSPTDANMSQGIEDIFNNMRRTNFLLGTPPVTTHAEEIFRLCRYAISRGNYTFSSEPTPGVNSGYMELYYYTLWNENQEVMQQEERHYFLRQLLNQGYIRRTRFIERLHICPNCHRSNLLFFESCPKCQSSELRMEHVIHHFRCANIAPESSYESDGELRCPKCRHLLRHIGVDYDKPSVVYTCNGCGESFMYSDMKVICANDRKKMKTEDLMPLDVEEYEFTPDGIRAFASNDVQFTISQVGFYGYSSMRDFFNYIRMIYNDSSIVDQLLIIRFRVEEPTVVNTFQLQSNVSPLVEAMKRLYTYKSAMQGNDFYFMRRVAPGELSAAQDNMMFELRSEFADYAQLHEGFKFDILEVYIYHPGEDVENFINHISEAISY